MLILVVNFKEYVDHFLQWYVVDDEIDGGGTRCERRKLLASAVESISYQYQ